MTTLTINIPDNDKSFISDILATVKSRGYELVITDDDDLSEGEFRSLKKGLEEARLIKNGKLNAIPASDIWK